MDGLLLINGSKGSNIGKVLRSSIESLGGEFEITRTSDPEDNRPCYSVKGEVWKLSELAHAIKIVQDHSEQLYIHMAVIGTQGDDGNPMMWLMGTHNSLEK